MIAAGLALLCMTAAGPDTAVFRLSTIDEPLLIIGVADLERLFTDGSARTFDLAAITQGNDTLYALEVPFGRTRFERVGAGTYRIHAGTPARPDLIRSTLLLGTTTTVTRDTTFHPPGLPTKPEIARAIKRRNELLARPSHASKNWDDVSLAAQDDLGKLCEQLFLGALAGDTTCAAYFASLQEDFTILQGGEHNEVYVTYAALLGLAR